MKNFINNKIVPALAHFELKKIEKYRNIHKGEECYIWGDGISVKYFDLNHFQDKISIPCAHIPFHKDFKVLKVPYAFYIESNWFYPYTKNTAPPYNYLRNHIQSEYKRIIKNRRDIQFFLSVTNYPTVNESNVVFIHKKFDYTKDDSILPSAKIFNYFEGSLRASIFLAYYLGFKKIYLIGFDYTHSPARVLHWHEKGEGFTKELESYNSDYFSLMQQVIEICTVTINSGSKLLPFIKYKDLTNYAPVFRENTELLTEKNMKTLATWPGYNIF